MRPCKTEPLCESHSVEIFFAQWFEKLLALSMVWGQSQEKQREGFPKSIGTYNILQKNTKFCHFFAKMNFGLLTLTPKKWLLILFDNFEDMLRGAGGFGCMRVAFEFRFFNNLCFVLSLESQITNFSGEMQNTDLLVQSTFSFKNGWEMQLLTTPLWSGHPCNKCDIFVTNKAWKN